MVRLQQLRYYALYNSKELFEIKNKNLDKVLETIRPADTSFMTQVLEPQTEKIYSHSMSYREWVFCSDRKGKLYET